MKITTRIFPKKLSLRAITALFSSLVLAFCFYSCSDDEALSEEASSSVIDSSICLLISSSNISDISVTRGREDDVYSHDGEFINSLCVFICDEDGKILDKRSSEDNIFSEDEKELALIGNLDEWTFNNPNIGDATQITVYAFANWETCNNEDLDNLIDMGIGETISVDDLAIEIDNPADKVDLTNQDESQWKYIPMSGMAVFEVSQLRKKTDNETENVIELIRLVGKVTVDIRDLEEDASDWDVTLTGLTFSSTAKSVLLFNEYQTDDYDIQDRSIPIEIQLDDYKVETGESKTRIAEFYVNETSGDKGFDVTLSVEENGDEKVYGPVTTTTRTTIPRNSVYALILSLDPYSVILTVSAWTSIIGVDGEIRYDLSSLQEYNLSEDEGFFYTREYSISLYDITSKYTILPTLWKVGDDEPIEDITWEWETSDEELDIVTTDGTLTATCLTATPGYTYEYLLNASWETSSGGEHQRSYNINVTFIDSNDMPILMPLSSRAWRTRSLGSEIVRMMGKIKETDYE